MNSQELWKERFSTFIQELQKYLRYIFNGHLLFVLIIGLGGLAYYYSEWVKTLDASFPAAFILALIFAVILTNSPIITLLKEPDMFFLLPVEKKLTPFFRKGMRISFIIQSYILLMVLAAAMPLYLAVEDGKGIDFIYFFIIFLIVKYANLRLKWNVLRYYEKTVHILDIAVRFCFNVVTAFILFSKANILFVIALLVVLFVLVAYFDKAVQTKLLKWELLLSLESKRMHTFYRFANLFTDVPKLKEKVARRKWLDFIFSFIGNKQGNTYTYLYIRTLVRSGDFLGLFIRLTVIGVFVLLSLTSFIPQLITAGLFVYMTAIQLIVIRKQHENIIWHDLYPIAEEKKNASVFRLLMAVNAVQIVIFSLVALFTGGLIALLGVIIVSCFVLLLVKSSYHKIISDTQGKWD